jgi:lysozyme family protein
MSLKFNDALVFLLQEEGGLVSHKDDPGGITKYGISKKSYPNVDIANLTKEQAGEIYMRDYWSKLPSDIPQSVKFLAFDFGVNAGINRAIKTIQKAIGTDPDGAWGRLSSAALAHHKERDVLINFTVERQIFYSGLPTFPVFGKGWLRRTLRAHDFASKFVNEV